MRTVHAAVIIAALIMAMAAVPASRAQETTVVNAKKALSVAKTELEKIVVLPALEDGGGAFLKSEYDRAGHLRELEKRAVRAGDTADHAAKYDLAQRLDSYQEKYAEEAFQAFIAYVAFVKVAREFDAQVKQDEAFSVKVSRIIDDLDALIERHGRDLRVPSLKLLYEDEPAGKVGAFNLRGKARTVKIEGVSADVYELHTLKGCVVLLKTEQAKDRKRFTLAEIVSKGECKTDAGETLNAVVLQAY